MEVKAKLRYLRISPRKVRLVIDLIRGLDTQEAIEQLNFMPKRSALPVLKLINSAVANAENNFKLKTDNLYIKKITADEGPKLKRWKPRAFGRATPILKRSSHITLILDERESDTKKTGKKEKIENKLDSSQSKKKKEQLSSKDLKKEKKMNHRKAGFRSREKAEKSTKNSNKGSLRKGKK